MEYGKLQGEIVAAAQVSGATLGASLIGTAFNVKGVSLVGAGHFAATLGDGVDQLVCTVEATANQTPLTVSTNNAGVDTDTVKHFFVVNAAGVAPPDNGGFYFVVKRTHVG